MLTHSLASVGKAVGVCPPSGDGLRGYGDALGCGVAVTEAFEPYGGQTFQRLVERVHLDFPSPPARVTPNSGLASSSPNKHRWSRRNRP